MYSSPDYYSAFYTYTYTFKGVPVNTFGTLYPKHGSAYTGIYTFLKSTDTKEYVYQHLLTPLKQDTIYCLSFFVSKADRTNFSVKNIDAYFSINTPSPSMAGYINALPQVSNTNGFITDTVNWVEIQGCFTAVGGEQYITIGNFNSNSTTDTLFVGTNNPFSSGGSDNSYYYIDSVSLWQNNFPTSISEINTENIFSVYPNPAKDVLNIEFSNANDKRNIELYNAIGELVLSESLTTQNSSLNIHHLSSGIYFYCILVNGIKINTNKIVIIK